MLWRGRTWGDGRDRGRHTVKHSSTLQSTVSLSSGESEYYGIVKGSATGLSVQALAKDWDLELKLELKADSSAGIGTAQRQGLGRLRHVQTRYLWVQERVRRGEVAVSKVRGDRNPSDMLTKPMGKGKREYFMKMIGQWYMDGRAKMMKMLADE